MMSAFYQKPHFPLTRAFPRASPKRGTKMKTFLAVALSLLFVLSVGAAAQNANPSSTSKSSTSPKSPRKRGPVFRSSKEQINQAQAILKDRGLYNGGQTGKLDTATRDGLKKYQE